MTNELDVPVLCWHSSSPELFMPECTDFDTGVPPGELAVRPRQVRRAPLVPPCVTVQKLDH